MTVSSQEQTKPARVASAFDVEAIRRDFPILSRLVHARMLVYFDNAATTQKPLSVIEAIDAYYRTSNANIHRGVHALSEEATSAYEDARKTIAQYINAAHTHEVVFVRGATEAINLVAATFGRTNVGRNDEVLVSAMEHHSNIVPWQMLCTEKGARLRVIPMNDRGELILDDLDNLLNDRTRIVAIAQVSNALGTVNPVRKITDHAHAKGIPVLVDGAQAMPHFRVDVRELGADFYVFSGHKVFGPTGTGVLYGREELLERMPPYQGGGDMIKSVTFEKTIFNDLPHKFEAGTPHIAGGIGLGAAIRYVAALPWDEVVAHETDVLEYATDAVGSLPGVRIVGSAREKAGVLSFVLADVHPHDVGTILDQEGVAIRTGHHCAQPVMERFGIPATARASFAFYNTRDEVDVLVTALHRVQEVFG